jgi:hypothetical protein
MSKQTKCWECWGLNGHHWNGCKTRGYAAVGPHPDAPPREADAPEPGAGAVALEMCCGGTCVRALCFIHSTEPKSAPVTTPDYEAFDCAPSASTPVARARALATAVPTGWKLLGPDDPEVSSDLIYATPDGGLAGVPQATPLQTRICAKLEALGLLSEMSVEVSGTDVRVTATSPRTRANFDVDVAVYRAVLEAMHEVRS